MRVLKFGGTSVANAQRFQDVAEIALDTAKRSQTALVLSAPAKDHQFISSFGSTGCCR